MDRREITSEIIEILSEESTFAKGIVLLGGDWGSGKTYLWENEIKSKLDPKKFPIIYISLFGIETIQDIKRSIVSQYLSQTMGIKDGELFKDIGNLKKLLNLIKPGLNSVQKYFGLELINFQFDPLDLINKTCIICFDDLERKSSGLDLKSILGLISYLVERKKAKILVISNEDVIAADGDASAQHEKSDYKRFSEKVVSFRYKLSPSFDEFYDLLAGGYKEKGIQYFIDNRDLILSFFKKSNSNNLRTLESAFRHIHRIIKSEINLASPYLEILLFYVICSSEGRLSANPKDFDITKHIVKQKLNSGKEQLSPEEEDKVKLHDRFFGNSYGYMLVQSLMMFVQSGYFDRIAIKKEIDPDKNELSAVQKYLKTYQSGPHLFFMNDAQISEKYEEGISCLNDNEASISAYELASLVAHLRICKKFLNQSLDPNVDQKIRALFENRSKAGDSSFGGHERFHLGHYQEYWQDYIPIYEKHLDIGVSQKIGKELDEMLNNENHYELLKHISSRTEYYKAFIFEIPSSRIADIYYDDRELGYDILLNGFKNLFIVRTENGEEFAPYRHILFQRIDQILLDKRVEASDIYRMREAYTIGQKTVALDEKVVREKYKGIADYILSQVAEKPNDAAK